MSGYGALSSYYDRLMRNVDYAAAAERLLALFARYRPDKPPALLLDLACGSGSLSLELASRGVDVIGVDGSADMLAEASAKAGRAGCSLLWLCQDMRELDLYGTVDGAVCMLDSLNHLDRTAELAEVFRRLFLFIEPGGLFLFDVNTPYKHREVLGDNTFVLEEGSVFCVWRNACRPRTGAVDMRLDFFERTGKNNYRRTTDFVRERAYSERTLRGLLNKAGMDTLAVLDAADDGAPRSETERLLFVARRRETAAK